MDDEDYNFVKNEPEDDYTFVTVNKEALRNLTSLYKFPKTVSKRQTLSIETPNKRYVVKTPLSLKAEVQTKQSYKLKKTVSVIESTPR